MPAPTGTTLPSLNKVLLLFGYGKVVFVFAEGLNIALFMGQAIFEVINMSKQGMARPDRTHTRPRNDVPPVPELQGKAKHGKKSRPIVSGTGGPEQKVYHEQTAEGSGGNPIPDSPQ